MFKKLKDKIAEEVKISPLKLQASVQQLAQAMVSPSSSVSSIQESTSNENFSIAEESEVSETPRNSPEKENSTFHRVDLHGDTIITPPRCPTVPRSRRSSASSMISDVSSLFPLYESPSNAYHFQSDLESTSEIEEIGGSTSHLQGISKEQLLTAYRKTQSRYHKYKGRYVDLARHFRELERQNGKIKMVLTETQDRALRKIAELKEQCMLEQKAKAHLEDALRNDLEEKDHLINTLETKVKLLKGVDASETGGWKQSEIHEQPLIDLDSKKADGSQTAAQCELSFQDKLANLETQLMQYQQSLNEQSEKLHQLNLDKVKVDGALVSQADENQKLKKELEAQRKREEEAALSLAENKMQVHRELEAREEEAKNLKALVAQLQEDLRISNRKKAIANGEPIALLSESSTVFEEPGAGGDGLPSSHQPVSELIQLKDVLRRKYKEVEVLVEENGRLRASLLMANSGNGSLERKLSNHENFLQSELEKIISITKGKTVSSVEMDDGSNLVQVQGSEGDVSPKELELKSSSFHEAVNETNEFNKKNIDLSSESHLRSEVGIKRQLSDTSNELNSEFERIGAEWKSKYIGVKKELDQLVAEKEEMRRLLEMQEIPSELEDDCATVNSDSLMHSLIFMLKEKSKWMKEEETLTLRLRFLDSEHEMLKGMLEKVEAEKNQLGMTIEQDRNEINKLNVEVGSLKEVTNRLTKEREFFEGEVVRLREIATNFDDLKNEADNVHTQSKIEIEKIKAQCSLEVSTISATLEEKENELQQARAELEHATSLSLNTANEKEEELVAKFHCLEEEIEKERQLRLSAEYSAKALQIEFYEEFMTTLSDGKLILQEAFENTKNLEQEVDRLKAQCEGMSLQETETKIVIQELQKSYDKQLLELQNNGKKALMEVESVIKERDEARRGEAEARKKAADAFSEVDTLRLKKQEAEFRAAKVQNELKAVRELEEKAKVEAEEAVHEQAAMRRSWEMQRDQIESMSREIEELKKAEDGLIRVLREVREEVKSKDCEINRLVEESLKEKNASSMNEEKIKNDVCGLKKLIEEHTVREEQIRKEMEKVKEVTNEWKEKSDAREQELEILYEEKKSLQRKLEVKEDNELKSAEAVKMLTDELAASAKNERERKLELVAANEEIVMIKKIMHENEMKVESLKHRNEELITLEKNLEEKLEMIENERSRLRIEEQEAKEMIGQLKEDRDRYKCQAEKSREEVEKLQILIDDFRKSQSKMENETEERKAEKDELRKRLEESEEELVHLQEKIAEILRNEEDMRKELEYCRSKNLKELELAENVGNSEREKVKELACVIQEEKELVQTLESDKNEALKNLEVANAKIKTLEERISSLDHVVPVELEELGKEFHSLKEELNEKNEGLKSEINKSGLEEELKRVIDAKGELENSLVQAQKEAAKKNELEARVVEMEQFMKKMEKEFDAAIANKDEEHQEQLSSYSERMEEEVGYVRKQLMEEIKGLREELIVKGDAYEQLLEQHTKMVNESRVELDTIRRELSNEKDQADKAVKNVTSEWMDHVSELEASHKRNTEELQRMWLAEMKGLEETSRVAVAAVESGTGSLSYLKRQIQAQAKELSETKRKYNSEILELRHLLSIGRKGVGDAEKSGIDDSTELEYLRNILYEYMMGKEPIVLAKVIAAVVKFDEEQTKKILTKEEQKLTLLGQFGLT